MTLREQARDYFATLQDEICARLAALDGRRTFHEDPWDYAAEGTRSAGGGRTRVLAGGALIEKGGVNLADVTGRLTERLAKRLGTTPQPFRATGISLVIHPLSPMVPTVHMNLRHIELEQTAWFGGGVDLTPFYLYEEDARLFHTTLAAVCDKHDVADYARFKQWCDEYFWIKHRGEARGIGGLFFDYLREAPQATFAFVQDVGRAFLEAYLPIVERRRAEPWGEAERQWHLLRRGRYVEFNLVYDRGTLFGLETQGRTESILMSLPPLVRWQYDHRPTPGSREAALLEVLQKPREWV